MKYETKGKLQIQLKTFGSYKTLDNYFHLT